MASNSIIQQQSAVSEFIEWDQQDLTRSSWVSPRYKYLFIGLGKTASTRIKLSLHTLEGYPVLERPFPWLHARDRAGADFVPKITNFDLETATEILTSPKWFRFCFVRNPYDRLLAAYKSNIILEMNPPSPIYTAIKKDIRQKHNYEGRTGRKGGAINFSDFIQFVQDTDTLKMDYHWCSLKSGLRPDLIDYDFVGYFENFQQDFRTVLEQLHVEEKRITEFLAPINQSGVKKIPMAAFYNWDLADQVYEIYKEDFETYGYERNSWLFDPQ